MSVVTATILSESERLDPAVEILSVEVHREVNRIPGARIDLLIGDVTNRTFPLSDSDFFAPGRTVEIKLRVGSADDATVFKGVVVGHAVEVGKGQSILRVDLKDAAWKLTGARRSAVFREQSDAQVIGKLVQDAGLDTGTVATTEPAHAELVQFHATDWDFLVSRADVQGLFVAVHDGTVSATEIPAPGATVHSFDFGIDTIYDIELQVDARGQPASIESVGWDVEKQEPTEPSLAESAAPTQGDLDPEQVAEAVGLGKRMLSHVSRVDPRELQAWADARLARARQSMIRGRITVPGLAEVGLLDQVELANVGERFNGTTIVGAVHHRFDTEGWRTELHLGLSPEPFCERERIADFPAAGLLPPALGLRIGVVDNFEEDPENQHRVKVRLPGMTADPEPLWARHGAPDAGADRGYVFRPETGDEVIVGFLNDDPRQPLILGSLYSSKNAPPEDLAEATEDNVHKGIVTKSGTSILLVDEEDPRVVIETPAANKVVLDDAAKTVEITDQHGNSVALGEDGILIKSAKDVTIDASGKVQVKGQAVDIS